MCAGIGVLAFHCVRPELPTEGNEKAGRVVVARSATVIPHPSVCPGFEPSPTTPEQFRELIRAESAKFAKIIVEPDIKLEQ